MIKSSTSTQSAYLWTAVLRTPFWALYNLLLFILYKDLHATPLQITLFIVLKPIVSLLSPYWSMLVQRRPDRLRKNIVWASLLGHLPFFLFPLYYSAGFVLFASALYMMMLRGVIPAWMELFKRDLSSRARQKVFTYGSVLSYLGGALLPFCVGWLLDGYPLSWRWLFPGTALLALTAIFFQGRLPRIEKVAETLQYSWQERLAAPWKEAWALLRRRSDFRLFQVGFMFGGFGLMMMQPALPLFFIDRLGLSYTELSIALTLCKGIGFALASPLFGRLFERIDIYRFSGLVTLLAALFPLLLLLATHHLFWIYGAYLLYGIMQAGSELSWHLSGPHFAKEEDSCPYSSVNVLTVGLRGCVGPECGSFLLILLASPYVLCIGGLACLIGTFAMFSSPVTSPTLRDRL